MSIPPALALTMLALAPVMAGDPAPRDGIALAQLTIHQRIIIRIPRMEPPPAPAPEPRRWVEKDGPKCVPLGTIEGAVVKASDQVELLVANNHRVRAMLDDDCPSLDFYSGFYLRQTPDGMVCAGRDSVRSRSGGACRITTFHTLRPRHWLDNLPLIRKR